MPIEFQFHQHCDTIERFDLPYSSFPLWKRACGYTILTIVALVTVSTLLSHYLPDHLPNCLAHWDAKANTEQIFQDVSGEEAKKLSFINYIRVWYLVLTYIGHICFSSGLTTPETHCKLVIIINWLTNQWY